MPDVDSDYLFVEIAAQRCVQLMRGAKPKVEKPVKKFTTLAIREVDEGLIEYRYSEGNEDAAEEVESEDAAEEAAAEAEGAE